MTDTLPPSLVQFERELELALERDLRPRPSPLRRRRVALAVALASVTAGLAAFAVASRVASTGVPSAWARQVIARAAAVIAPGRSPATILHIVATQTMTPLAVRASAYAVPTMTEEAWLQQGPPFAHRVFLRPAGGATFEEGNARGIYNLTGNVLYHAPPLPSANPRYTLRPGPRAGTFRLRVKGYATTTIPASTARAVRNGTDEVGLSLTWNGRVQRVEPLILPTLRTLRAQPYEPDPAATVFAGEVRGLLGSDHARVVRTTTRDGRPAIEIASVHPLSGPRTTYYVDPRTYAPIELDIYGYDSPRDLTRIRVSIYRRIRLAGHRDLLRFSVPGTARIDRTPRDYWESAPPPMF